MNESIVVTSCDPKKIDFESWFFKKHLILKWDEFIVLNNDRILVNEKIAKKVITKYELLSQFKVELSLLNTCKLKIIDELEKTDDVIDTQILVILCKRIIDLFDHMHVLFSVEEDMLSCFIDFCQDYVSYINAEQLDILLDAVLKTENSQTIWMQLLKLHLNLSSLDKLMNVFQEGVRLLKQDSLPLWKILIRHLQHKRPDMVQTLLEEGSNISYENISLDIRPKYLVWCLEFRGIDAARELFNELKDLKPPCCKLYLTMIAIETEESGFELDTIRNLYNEACTLFGRSNTRVWIDYMRFENTHGNKALKCRIFNKAVWKFESKSLRNNFISESKDLEREFWIALGKEVIVVDD